MGQGEIWVEEDNFLKWIWEHLNGRGVIKLLAQKILIGELKEVSHTCFKKAVVKVPVGL